ncbi:MAG: hypothetical protein H6704_16755 [Myxococcales bacterium]|nr:hypothetical protein [Myxococcales bacterium]
MKPTSRAHALVIGPDAPTRAQTLAAVRAAGFDATDGGEGWAALDEAGRFDLIVCDEGDDAGLGEEMVLAAALRGLAPMVVVSDAAAGLPPRCSGAPRLSRPIEPAALRAASARR